jgi:hypothetical protein
MGLDMYLTKHIYIGANYEHNKITGRIALKKDGKKIPVNLNRVSEIIEESGYWRKENEIHQWFVENVQEGKDDCGTYYVSEENIKDLLLLVNEALANHEKAPSILPTQSGFFFGSCNYDQYYFQGLERTKKILEDALLNTDGEYYYHSSW